MIGQTLGTSLSPETFPKLQEIRLITPYTPITIVSTKDNAKFKPKDLIIWSKDQPNPVPATVRLGEKVALSVTLSDYGFNGRLNSMFSGSAPITWTLKGQVPGNSLFEIESEPVTIAAANSSSGNPITVETTLQFSGGSDVPWGLKDDIVWSIHVHWTLNEGSGDTKEPVTLDDFCRTPIELYGICGKLVDWYSDGVPLELLQLFVQPASKVASIKNLDDWVKWVVKRCHASRADPDCDVPMDERIHGFRYNVWTGAPSYVRGYGGGYFSLDKWLEDSRDDASWSELNCYDQAGIVQCALSLGVPKQNVSWEYKAPFGYINKTDLVGWGITNNPFYRAVAADKLLSEKDLVSSRGSSFSRHSFISYVNNKGLRVALDACAGPAIGAHSIADYLKGCIDNGDDKSLKEYASWGYKDITQIKRDSDNGIRAINNQRPTGTHYSHDVISDPPVSDIERKEWQDLAKDIKVDGTQNLHVDLAAVFKKFRPMVKDMIPPDQAQGLTYREHQPRTQIYNKKVLFHQVSLDVVNGVSPGRPLVSLTMRVLPTAADAIKEVNVLLSAIPRNLEDLFMKPSQDRKMLGHLHLEAKEPSGLNIFVYGNILCYLDGSIDSGSIKSLARSTEQLLSEATGEHPKINNEIYINAPHEVKVGDEFEVVVTCPDASDVCPLSTNNYYFNQTTRTVEPEHGGSPGKWIFTFVALRTERRHDETGEHLAPPGKDTIEFTCYHKVTGLPETNLVEVHVSET